MLHGSINHVSITVSHLLEAMRFFGPLLEFLGYATGQIFRDERSGHDLTVNPLGLVATTLCISGGRDRLKFEIVHMPLAEQRARSFGFLRTDASPNKPMKLRGVSGPRGLSANR